MSLNITLQPISDIEKKQLVVVIFDTAKPNTTRFVPFIDAYQKSCKIVSGDGKYVPKWTSLSSYCANEIRGYCLPFVEYFNVSFTFIKTYLDTLLLIKKIETNSHFYRSFQYFSQRYFQNCLLLSESEFGACEC